MEVSKKNIKGVIKNTAILRIPFFQRKYVWKKEMWEDFLEAMFSVSEESENDHDYFMGPVIIKELDSGFGNSDIGLVIDGQQRLITMFLFFKLLCEHKGKQELFHDRFYVSNEEGNSADKKIGLEPSRKDAKIFNDIINDKIENIENHCHIKKHEKEIYNSKVYQCYNFFLENKKQNDWDKLSIKAINKYICFVLIELKDKEDEQQVFDTINTLGIKLTAAELVKNYLFNNDEEKTGEKEYDHYWAKTFEGDRTSFWDRVVTSGRQYKDNIEIFFQAFFDLYNEKSTSKEYTKLSSLYKKYKKFIDKKGIKENKEKRIKFLEDLTYYGDLYFDNIKKESLEESLNMGSAMQRINIIIFSLNTTTIIPYILYILKNVEDVKEKEQILSLVENFIMRRFICKFSSKGYNKLFATLHKEGHSTETLKKWMGKNIGINEPSSGFPQNEKLLESFKDFSPNNETAKIILYFIESHLHSKDIVIPLKPFSNYSLEHIMPKKWETHWPLPQDVDKMRKIERKNKIGLLGNMTILPQSLNSRLSNKNWQNKKAGTNGYPGLKVCAKGVKSFDDEEGKYLKSEKWDENTIDDRTKYLADWAIKIWDANTIRPK